jgi:ribosomal subunit interface protein
MTEVEIVVRGRHVDVSSRFREQATDKLSRVERFGQPIQRVDVELSKEQNPRLADRAYEVELTCRGKGPVIRAEAAAADKYSALDMAIGRLEERLRRAHDKTKIVKGGANHRVTSEVKVEAAVEQAEAEQADELADTYQADADEVYVSGPVVVRDKTHPTVPMSIEQAVTEMELVGHDFFLFQEVESGAPAVVYRRRGYDYGLIRIDVPGAAN